MHNPQNLLPADRDQTVILIAEDDNMIRDVARIALEREGFFILTADDGEGALLFCRTYPGEIHLLLSDINMPQLDGLQLRNRILEERPNMKVLLMSGYIDFHVHGGPFLRKPSSPTVLKNRISELLARAGTPQCAVGS